MQPILTALLRGALGGFILAGMAFFGSLAAHQPLGDAEVQAGVAFFGYLAVRGIGEGALDQSTKGGA